MHRELTIDIMKRKVTGFKGKLLSEIEPQNVIIQRPLYIGVNEISINEDKSVEKNRLYQLWIGKELTFEELVNYGLGKLKQAKEVYDNNPKTRFLIPFIGYSTKKKIGKPDWFPDSISNWYAIGENDKVVSNYMELVKHIEALKYVQRIHRASIEEKESSFKTK